MNILPVVHAGKLIVISGPHAACRESLALIVELGLRGPVTILDGGNRYKPNQVAIMLGRKCLDVTPVANRLFSRRAFTCYEMNTLLGSTPHLHQPYVILDLLHTFYDDHTPTYEVSRLLRSCLGQIQRLQTTAPVIVTLSPPMTEERAFLLDEVYEKADQLFTIEDLEARVVQSALF